MSRDPHAIAERVEACGPARTVARDAGPAELRAAVADVVATPFLSRVREIIEREESPSQALAALEGLLAS